MMENNKTTDSEATVSEETEKQNIQKKGIDLKRIATISAYIIPVIILSIVVYYNFLPFGYNDQKKVVVGAANDTNGQFKIEEGDNLGSRQTLNGKTFRIFNGVVNAVYEPSAVLNNTEIVAKVAGDNVFLLDTPSLDIPWDTDWQIFDNFSVYSPKTVYDKFLQGNITTSTQGVDLNQPFALLIKWKASANEELLKGDIKLVQSETQIKFEIEDEGKKELTYQLPDYFLDKEHVILIGYNKNFFYWFVDKKFIGKVETTKDKYVIRNLELTNNTKVYSAINNNLSEDIAYKEANGQNCVYFDGQTRLSLPGSTETYETGPWAVYVEWIPEKREDSQQIIGHYNWKIEQNKNTVKFTIGRMNNKQGSFYTATKKIDDKFFNKSHNLLATYVPGERGMIDLFVDGAFADRVVFDKEVIQTDYGKEDLSLGWSAHNYGKSPYFKGTICRVKFANRSMIPEQKSEIKFVVDSVQKITIPVYSEYGKLESVELKAMK